jgi:hypothetical protein
MDSRRPTEAAGDVLEGESAFARLNPSSRLKETLADLLTQVQSVVWIGETENIGQGILDRAPDEDDQLFF